MNISRLQVVLNHNDPDIVLNGINEFTKQILLENNSIESFGYNGRSCTTHFTLSSQNAVEVKGLLESYIKSSPQLEELFILWDMSGRESNKPLIVAHLTCIAAILHIAKGDSNFCERISQRILSDYSKSLLESLSSNHSATVHSTIGLLIAICRLSQHASQTTYTSILSQSSTLSHLLQKGKETLWTSPLGEQLFSDSRCLISLLVLLLTFQGDPIVVSDLVSNHKSLLRRVFNGLSSDPPHTVELIVVSLIEILKDSQLSHSLKIQIFDKTLLHHMMVYTSHDNNAKYEIASQLIHKLTKIYINMIIGQGHSNNQKQGNNYNLQMLMRELSPHLCQSHREVSIVYAVIII
jgi:hypothetical protein